MVLTADLYQVRLCFETLDPTQKRVLENEPADAGRGIADSFEGAVLAHLAKYAARERRHDDAVFTNEPVDFRDTKFRAADER